MMLINLTLAVMAFVVALEFPLQVVGKIVVWIMLANSGTLAAQAAYNQMVQPEHAYALPLHRVERAALTVTEITAAPGITRNREGRPSGLKIDLSGYLRNYTDRRLVAVTVHCRWNYGAFEEGKSALFDIPVDSAPGTLTQISYTYKSRDHMAPNLSEFQSHCHVRDVKEFDQWEVLGDS